MQTYSFLEAYIDMLFFSCFQGAKGINFGAVVESIQSINSINQSINQSKVKKA